MTTTLFRFLKLSPVIGFFLTILSVSLMSVPAVQADDHGSIRLYKLNKKGQPVKQNWVGKQGLAGCQNLRLKREVFRVAQIGYEYCVVYSKKDCESGSEVQAMWDGKRYRVADIDIKQPQTKLLRGSKWVLNPDQNVIIRSWQCEYPSE